MGHDPSREKLDDLAARIRQAAGEASSEKSTAAVEPIKASRIGFDFVGAVLACMFLGWLADTTLGTKPFGLIGMIVIGFAVGIANVWRAMQRADSRGEKEI